MDNNLKMYRNAINMSQRDLARRTGLHWRTIQQWEAGERQLTNIHSIRLLASTLGCTVDDLVPPPHPDK